MHNCIKFKRRKKKFSHHLQNSVSLNPLVILLIPNSFKSTSLLQAITMYMFTIHLMFLLSSNNSLKNIIKVVSALVNKRKKHIIRRYQKECIVHVCVCVCVFPRNQSLSYVIQCVLFLEWEVIVMLLFTNEHVTLYKNIQNYKYIESMHHKTRVYAPRVTFVLIYLKFSLWIMCYSTPNLHFTQSPFPLILWYYLLRCDCHIYQRVFYSHRYVHTCLFCIVRG